MTDLAFDTETDGFEWWEDRRPFMVQWADDRQPTGQHALMGRAGDDPAMLRKFAAAVKRCDRLVGHNLPFDLHHWEAATGQDLTKGKRVADTQLAAQIAEPQRRIAKEEDGRGYKLKALSETFVDPEARDSELELERLAEEHGFKLHAKPGQIGYVEGAYYKLWTLEPGAVEFYGREDARMNLPLVGALEARMTAGMRRIWDLEQQVTPIIFAAESRGILVDSEAAVPLRREYVDRERRLRDELDKQLMDGWDENNDNLAEALLKAGVPLTEMTDSGEHLATNKWALEKLVDEHPVIQTLFDWREAGKFVSTYLDHIVGHDIIHPSFPQIGTWTGRMASRNPNMQNVPVRHGKAIRELYVPRPGYCFVGIDFEQIEFRLLCYYLNDRRMVELMEAGHDPFAQLAADVFGGDAAEYRKGAPKEDKRTICKNTTYAVIYGAGGLKVCRMLGWKPDSVYTKNDWVVKNGYKREGEPRSKAAENLIKRLKSALVGYGSHGYNGRKGSGLIGRIDEKVGRLGAVDTILGRHQWLGYDKAYKGLSGLIQGGAADLFKLALVDSYDAVKDLGAHPLLFIHDETLWEVPLGYEHEVERLASEAMCQCYPLRPGLQVESHIAYNNWGETK